MTQAGKLLGFLFIILGTSTNLFGQLSCETITTYGGGGSCDEGTWKDDETWTCDPTINNPPIDKWKGSKIVVSHPIRICNNDLINLLESDLDTMIIESGASVEFRANSKIILPEDAIIILDSNATLVSTNNESQGTLMAFGETGIWGKACCCNDPIPGPLTIGQSTILCPDNGILPIELASFTAHKEKDMCRLKWVTHTEVNNDHFKLEFSENMIDWSVIHIEPSNGDATTIQEYEFLDTRHVESETSYYRLSQKDFDGREEELKTLSFHRKQLKERLEYFPSIVKNNLTIRGNLKDLNQIFIYDFNGNLYDEHIVHKSDSEVILSFEHIRSGTYFVALEKNNGREVFKLVKSND